jgi:hypothetical protein
LPIDCFKSDFNEFNSRLEDIFGVEVCFDNNNNKGIDKLFAIFSSLNDNLLLICRLITDIFGVKLSQFKVESLLVNFDLFLKINSFLSELLLKFLSIKLLLLLIKRKTNKTLEKQFKTIVILINYLFKLIVKQLFLFSSLFSV